MADRIPPITDKSSRSETAMSKNFLYALLVGIGVPALTLGALRHEVERHQWLATGFVLVYELILAGIGLFRGTFAEAGKDLQERWGRRLADVIDARISLAFSGYKRRYLEHLIYRHRNLDVKGLSTIGPYNLDLEQVFVSLKIIPQPPFDISSNPIRSSPDAGHKERHAIWDYLSSKFEQKLVIIGAPGSGKTTLLKFVTLVLAGKARRQGNNIPKKLPLLLFLRDHVETIKENPNFSLSMAVRDSLAKFSGPAPPSGWFENALAGGHCIALLDGLDEVADSEARQAVAAWVETQMVAHGRNIFIITSRPFGYRTNPVGGVSVLEVRSFNRSQQVQFVHNWYLANEIKRAGKDDAGVRMDARLGAEDLLRRLQNAPTLSELAVNPLLLTMIATVHCYRSALPGRRVELYKEICDVFLGTFQQARGIVSDFTPAQKQRILQPLAYHMMCRNTREITVAEAKKVLRYPLQSVSTRTLVADFLKMIENSSGLILEREAGIYGFAHLTFQEYLAAVHIHEQKLENDLTPHLHDSWWHETIRLYCALASDATPVIEACLAGSCIATDLLALAVECLEEAGSVQPELRDQVEKIISEQVESKDPELRRIAAETLLTLRLHRLVRINDDKYIDGILIRHAEYQLFLDERYQQGNYYQPDHWTARQFPSGEGLKPVVGIRASDALAFCKWLTQREVGRWQFRPPIPNESGIGKVASRSWKVTPTEATVWEIEQADANFFYSTDVTSPNFSLMHALLSDRARARAHARDIAPTVSSALALVQETRKNITLARNLESAHALVQSLDRALDLDHNSAFVRARDVDLAYERSCNLVRDLETIHSHVTDVALNFAFECAKSLRSILGLAYYLERTVLNTNALAYMLNACDASNLHLTINDRIALYQDPSYTLDRARTLAVNVTRSPSVNVIVRSLFQEHIGDLEQVLHRNHTCDLAINSTKIVDLIRARAGTLRLMMLFVKSLNPGKGEAVAEDANLNPEIGPYSLNVYAALTNLQERIENPALAVEGLLLVKERLER